MRAIQATREIISATRASERSVGSIATRLSPHGQLDCIPAFYAAAMDFSAGSFPDFVHLASVTYLDIIVSHDEIALRTLFHGLVHATQMALLGVDRYTDLYVRGFVKSRSWIAIPLEAQAYQLDTRFAMSPTASFSVEDEVSSWAQQGRY